MAATVIIGSGLAAYTLAKNIRKLDSAQELLMICADSGEVYSKPMLSNALGQQKTAEMLVSSSAEQMAASLNLTIRTHTRVLNIDRTTQQITLDNDEHISYGKLVLALGADPIHLDIAGEGAKVYSINDLQDYRTFRAALSNTGKQIVLLGGGLIGCEYANDLVNAGYQVTIVEYMPLPLGRLLPEAAGLRMKEKFIEAGITWLGGITAKQVTGSGDKQLIELSNGQLLTADIVLSAVGLRARTQLAANAGLKTNRGIVADSYLTSNDPNIYALGDCAEVNGQLLPFVMPLMQGAKALAATLTGNPTAVNYPAMPVTVKTPVYPLSILPPAMDITGSWTSNTTAETEQFMFYDEQQQLRGFVLAGKTNAAQLLAKQVIR